MTEDVLEKLKQTDLTLLTHIVRQVQRSPSFEIAEWSVRRLSDGGEGKQRGQEGQRVVPTGPERSSSSIHRVFGAEAPSFRSERMPRPFSGRLRFAARRR